MKRISLSDLADLVQCGKVEAATYCWRCSKILYPSLTDARRVGAEMARKGKGHTRPIPCAKGHGWHLTSKRFWIGA